MKDSAKTIEVTIQQYAKRRKISDQAAWSSVKKSNGLPDTRLPGVILVSKIGKNYYLTIKPSDVIKGRAKKYKK